MSFSIFTQYVAYQPGTTSRTGNPLSSGKGSPFISYASNTSSPSAISTSSDFLKLGVPANTGLSIPLKRTVFAVPATPARASTSLSRAPRQRAFPIAPFAHCPPATRGWKNPRLLPAHSQTAVTSAGAKPVRSSASDIVAGLSTSPRTVNAYCAGSTDVGTPARCQRTKNASLGVRRLSSKTANGVSSWTGRDVKTINGRFCGYAASERAPLVKGSSTVSAPEAAAIAGLLSASPPIVAPTPVRNVLRRMPLIIATPSRAVLGVVRARAFAAAGALHLGPDS